MKCVQDYEFIVELHQKVLFMFLSILKKNHDSRKFAEIININTIKKLTIQEHTQDAKYIFITKKLEENKMDFTISR